MSSASVTVLMTVFNGGELLKQSLTSVLRQSFGDFEFLIVDDCSTDDSEAVIRSFKDSRIVLHHNHKNLGQSRSLNLGFHLAKGEYVARIDADDLALPDWLEKHMIHLKINPGAVVFSPAVAVIDENNEVRKQYRLPEDYAELVLRSFIRSPINHVGSLLHRQTVLNLGGYDERCRIAADFNLWGKVLRGKYKVITIPEVLMAIREHEMSLSRAKRIGDDLDELSGIMQENINHFSQISFDEIQVRLLAQAVYDPQNLSIEQFERALEVLEKIAQNLSPILGLPQKRLKNWHRRIVSTTYVRKVFAEITQKDNHSAQSLSREAVRRLGWFSPFSIFLLLSFFNGFLNVLPNLYKVYVSTIAKVKFRSKLKLVNAG